MIYFTIITILLVAYFYFFEKKTKKRMGSGIDLGIPNNLNPNPKK
jgi:hypothetical protein